jgi:hypothetical protein
MNVHAPTEDKTDHREDSFRNELDGVFDKFAKYHTKILLGDFSAKVGREYIFKPIISNDNGARVVNFATPKSLTVKITMFPHSNINKFTWTSL